MAIFNSYVCLPEGINGVKFITTEPCSPEAWESWFILGKSSKAMAEQFRLVKYYKLPRFINGVQQAT